MLIQIIIKLLKAKITEQVLKAEREKLSIPDRGTMIWLTFDFPGAQTVKNLPAVQETGAQSLGWEDPLEEGMAPTPVFLPGESMDRSAWWATVCGVTKSWTQLSN